MHFCDINVIVISAIKVTVCRVHGSHVFFNRSYIIAADCPTLDVALFNIQSSKHTNKTKSSSTRRPVHLFVTCI